jgi:hypothetical protein
MGRAEIMKHLAIINYRSRTSNNLNMIAQACIFTVVENFFENFS